MGPWGPLGPLGPLHRFRPNAHIRSHINAHIRSQIQGSRILWQVKIDLQGANVEFEGSKISDLNRERGQMVQLFGQVLYQLPFTLIGLAGFITHVHLGKIIQKIPKTFAIIFQKESRESHKNHIKAIINYVKTI